MLLNLELWYRTFIDGDGVQTLPAPALTSARVPPSREAVRWTAATLAEAGQPDHQLQPDVTSTRSA
jgi:hypothetical protein